MAAPCPHGPHQAQDFVACVLSWPWQVDDGVGVLPAGICQPKSRLGAHLSVSQPPPWIGARGTLLVQLVREGKGREPVSLGGREGGGAAKRTPVRLPTADTTQAA